MPSRRRLLSSRTYLRLLEARSLVGTWSYDYDTNVSSWSPGMYKLLGRDPDEVKPGFDSALTLIHPDDRHKLVEARSMQRSGQESEALCRVLWADGQTRWIVIKGVPNVSPEGKLTDIVGYALDVTDQQRILEVHRQREKRLALLAKSHGVLIWTCRPDGAIFDLPFGDLLSEIPFSRIRGFGWLDLVHPSDRRRVSDYLGAQIEAGRKSSITFNLQSSLAGHSFIRVVLAPVENEHGDIIEWVGMSLGIPEAISAAKAPAELQGRHLRAARAILDWSMETVAERADASLSTIRRAEEGGLSAIGRRLGQSLLSAFETAGVTFREISPREVAVISRDCPLPYKAHCPKSDRSASVSCNC